MYKKIYNKLQDYFFNNDERTNQMRKNTLMMIIVRGFSILISLLYVPMLLHAVDKAEYGILLTLTSIIHWVALLDVGLGNGLRNTLPQLLSDKDYAGARKIVSSCYFALSIYVGIIIVVFLLLNNWISWQSVLNAYDNEESELNSLAVIVFIAFCVQFLLGLINSILFACQFPAYTSILNLVSQFVAFIVVAIMIYGFGESSILNIGSVTCLIPPLIILIGSICLFKTKLKEITPSLKEANLKSVNKIILIGGQFFILQIITILLFQANNIIISQSVGQEAVVVYNIAFKYISMISMVFYLIIAPLWSAVTEAYYKEDFVWIKKTEKHIIKIFKILFIVGVVMVVVSKLVYSLWLGKDTIDIPYIISFLMLLYVGFEMLYKIYGSILNGMGKLKVQMIATSLIAIFYIPSALYFGYIYGLKGILSCYVIVFFLNFIWSKVQYTKIINKTAKGIWNL